MIYLLGFRRSDRIDPQTLTLGLESVASAISGVT